ncbi:hypothetical protein FRC11_010565, partial [Ceratobasidium sp. 423]
MVNQLGCADSFFPIDQLQEHNNRAVREYGPPAHSATWELYGKMSRVIPFYAEVVEFVEGNLSGLSHSHIHKNPKHEKDVQALIAAHKKLGIHEIVPDRKVATKDAAKD